MNQHEATALAERIHKEFPDITAECVKHGYPGYDEAWYVKITRTTSAGTASTEIEDERQWDMLKTALV